MNIENLVRVLVYVVEMQRYVRVIQEIDIFVILEGDINMMVLYMVMRQRISK